MKRYRVITVDFDTRALILEQPILPDWEQQVKESWIKNKNEITQSLIAEFGQVDYPIKINNFTEIGVKPFSVVAFHNRFFQQARIAFVIGAYYPALTGTSALGERILNHLILRLRDYFKSSADYKRVHQKDSFDNWNVAIEILEKWGVLLPDTVAAFARLQKIRNESIHFEYSTDYHDRQYALQALKEMAAIIMSQFPAAGLMPWFIPNTKGTTYIKKEFETDPFVKEVYLPNCALVGPKHTMNFKDGRWFAVDENTYEDWEVTDEEFVALARQNRQA